MKLVAYRTSPDSAAQMGVLLGESVAPLTSLEQFYSDVPAWSANARSLTTGKLPLTTVELAVPVPVAAKVVCVAINYVEHGREGNLPTPSFPNLFARWSSTLITDGKPVAVPSTEPEGLDWEVELAAIVGRTLRHTSAADAEAGMLGYTVFNDISGRASQLQSMTLSTGQWALGKNLDNSGAVGSIIATSDSVDLSNTRLTTKLNGETMQDGTTADMVFKIGDLIEFITRTITLNPGDLIATGTPHGVGFGRKPRLYMKPGDTVEVAVQGICSVRTPIVALN